MSGYNAARLRGGRLAAMMLAVALVLSAPAGAWAAVTVCAAGCNYSSIDAASDAEPAGQTINMLPGDYNEDVTIQSGKDGQTFNGAKSGQDARTRSTEDESIVNGGWTIGSNNITINGFTIQNESNAAGIAAGPAVSGYSILDNILTNNGFGLDANNGGATPSSSNVQFNRFKNNNNGDAPGTGRGIFANDSTKSLTIQENEFIGHTGPDIQILGSGNQDIAVRDNFGDEGFRFFNVTNLAVRDNEVTDANLALDIEEVSNADVLNNELSDSASGALLRVGSDIEVRQNEIINNSSRGILVLGGLENVTIADNTITGNNRGINTRDTGDGPSSGVEITGNTVVNNADGILVEDASHNGPVEVHLNRIIGNDGGNTGVVNQDLNDEVDAEDNWWGCNEGPAVSDTGCDQVSGDVSFNPWLVLTVEADSDTIIKKTGATLVTASLRTNSDGNQPAGGDQFPDGATVTFKARPDDVCKLIGDSTDQLEDGDAHTTVKAKGETGKCKVKAILDAEKAKAIIQVVKP